MKESWRINSPWRKRLDWWCDGLIDGGSSSTLPKVTLCLFAGCRAGFWMPTVTRYTAPKTNGPKGSNPALHPSPARGLNAFNANSDQVQFAEFHATGFTSVRRRGKRSKEKPEFFLTSSKFGIDGSSPPLVSSWSYKPIRKRHSKCNGRCLEPRPRSGPSSLPEVQSPKWGFTSPAFHSQKTPPRATHAQSKERSRSLHLPPRAKVHNPDMMVQRASLFCRPHKEIFAAKGERDCRLSFSKGCSHSCPVSPVNQKAVGRLGRLVILDMTPARELSTRAGHARFAPHAWAARGELVSRASQGTDSSDPRERQSDCSVRKINIKLPCLPWNWVRKRNLSIKARKQTCRHTRGEFIYHLQVYKLCMARLEHYADKTLESTRFGYIFSQDLDLLVHVSEMTGHIELRRCTYNICLQSFAHF